MHEPAEGLALGRAITVGDEEGGRHTCSSEHVAPRCSCGGHRPTRASFRSRYARPWTDHHLQAPRSPTSRRIRRPASSPSPSPDRRGRHRAASRHRPHQSVGLPADRVDVRRAPTPPPRPDVRAPLSPSSWTLPTTRAAPQAKACELVDAVPAVQHGGSRNRLMPRVGRAVHRRRVDPRERVRSSAVRVGEAHRRQHEAPASDVDAMMVLTTAHEIAGDQRQHGRCERALPRPGAPVTVAAAMQRAYSPAAISRAAVARGAVSATPTDAPASRAAVKLAV